VGDQGTDRLLAVRKIMRSGIVAFAALVLVALTGCGVYTLNPKGKSSIKTIGVEAFQNQTGEYAFADRLTEIVTDAFIKDGSLKVVPVDGADAVLVGTLTKYSRVPFKFDSGDNVSQYKIILEFDISLRNPREQTDIWKEHLTPEGVYTVASETEEIGQSKATDQLVQSILNKTTRSW
jgi:hypothetical protein